MRDIHQHVAVYFKPVLSLRGSELPAVWGGSGDTLQYLGRGGVTQEAFRNVISDWEDENDVTVQHTSVADDTEMVNVVSENPGGIDLCNPSSGGFIQFRERTKNYSPTWTTEKFRTTITCPKRGTTFRSSRGTRTVCSDTSRLRDWHTTLNW